MTRTTPILLDRMEAALAKQGVGLKRSQLLETAAAAFGFHNQREFSAAAKRGDLDAAPAEVLGRVETCDTALVVVRDAGGGVYGIEESFLEQAVEEERRERYCPSPYGGLVDLSEVGAHPAAAWAATPAGHRYVVLDGDLVEIGDHDDLDAAKAAVEIEDDVSKGMIVDIVDGRALHYQWGWRDLPVKGRDRREVVTAAALAVTRARLQRSRTQHEQTLRLDVPDWRAWEKDLKKVSHTGQEPISNEVLHQMRHAVADASSSKSSQSERFEVNYRRQRYAEKHLGGLIARLDRAEEALRQADLAPAEIARKSKDDAAERLAAIEDVTPRRQAQTIIGLHQVEATRDGSHCLEYFTLNPGEDLRDKARRIVCRMLDMGDPEDFADEDGDLWMLESDCDSFDIEEVAYPDAAAIITDALVELSTGGDFRHGVPTSHPARIKLIAARDMIVPKPTVAD